MSLAEHLAAAAVEDGDVPVEVAEWVDGGARPDPAEVDGHDVDTAYQRAKRWEVDSIGAATWAFRKLAAAEAALGRVQEQYDRERKRLDQWFEREQRPHGNTAIFMEDRLTRWALAQREANPKQATFSTPAGKVETRMPSAPWRVEIGNKPALLAWALENGRDDLVRPELRPVTEVRKAVSVVEKDDGAAVVDAATGQVVPGLTAEPTRPTVTIRPAVTE